MQQIVRTRPNRDCTEPGLRPPFHLLAVFLLLVFLLQADWLWASDGVSTQTIGVLAHRGKEQALKTWQPTADYLTRSLPGYKFQILALEHAELEEAVVQRQVDFVLSNPENYVVLEARHRVTRIATLQQDFKGQPLKEFGGLIFTRSDRTDLHQLSDLKGRRIAAVAKNAFGAYQMQVYELLKAGMDPDDIKPVFVGLPQDKIVTMVAEGKVDAGFVLSGLLESMAAAGKINLQDFRGIHLEQQTKYPFLTSTALYPEWAFSILPHVEEILASHVAIALLSLEHGSDAARSGEYHGWSFPLSYNSVREMMWALRAPPYDAPADFSVSDIVRKFDRPIMVGLIGILAVLGFFMQRYVRLNRSLTDQMALVAERSHSLAIEVESRSRAERQLANENRVLDLLAQEVALPQILQVIAKMCQVEFRNAGVAVFLREGDGYHLVAAEHLDEALRQSWIDAPIPVDDADDPTNFAAALTVATATALSEVVRGGRDEAIGQLVLLLPATAEPPPAMWPLLHLYATLTDMAIQRSAIAERLRLSSSVFQNALEGIVISDSAGRIVDVSPSFTHLTGYTRDEAIGKTMSLLKSGRHDAQFYNDMWMLLLGHGHWSGEIWNRTKDGRIIAEMLQISSVKDSKGRVTHYVGTFSEITSLKDAQAHLEQLASFDSLTGLPNRALLADRLNQALPQARRRDKLLAICFLDLDGFKEVNDTFGHEAGDVLLREVAQRLSVIVRLGDTVARLGGDEFVLVLADLKDVDELEDALQRVLLAVASPYDLGGRSVQVSASIGATLFPFDEGDSDSLLRHADQAMYRAKQDGRNRYRLFDTDYAAAHLERILQRDRLRLAVKQQELVLYYQPQVSLHGKGISGVEALLRWQHPEKGLMSPGDFLPDVEHDDLICEIGIWVLREALTQQRYWKEQGTAIPVSVNIATRQFHDSHFLPLIDALLAEFPDRIPGSIEFEILESAAIEDTGRMILVIEHCHKLGVKFALDDFGTAYSSLTYLQRFPADTLKIDRSFVNGMLASRSGLAIVESIVGLANAFQCELVAEGIETTEQGELLARMGCAGGQGYFIARPIPAAEILPWIASFRLPERWAAWKDVVLSGQDFPLLLAEFEHRCWVKDLIDAIVDGRTLITRLEAIDNPEHCEFGRWLEQRGRARYGKEPHFAEVDQVHHAIHDLGRQIHRSLLAGSTDEARRSVPELQRLSDRLVAALGLLQREAVNIR